MGGPGPHWGQKIKWELGKHFPYVFRGRDVTTVISRPLRAPRSMSLKIQNYDYMPLQAPGKDRDKPVSHNETKDARSRTLKQDRAARPVHSVAGIGFLKVAPAAMSCLFCLSFIAGVAAYLVVCHVVIFGESKWLIVIPESSPRLLLLSSVGSNLIGFVVSGSAVFLSVRRSINQLPMYCRLHH